ncbi:MAG: Putative Glycosyl transferase, group 1 [Nitrospira sp.]|nr:MAG: Putative Glycosyl transferase, group 1 [Nitrospira sp.]
MANRLLFLAPAPPSDHQGGGALRMLHLLRFLGSRFQVDLIAPAVDGWQDAQRLLQGVCAETTFVPPQGPGLLDRIGRVSPYGKDRALASVVRERLASGAYGAVHVEKLGMIPSLPAQNAIPVVLDIWSYGQLSPLRILTGGGAAGRPKQLVRRLKVGWYDRWCWPLTYCVTVVSEEDRIRCEGAHPGQRVLVVPSGVDCQAIRPKPDHAMTSPVLLFTGDMGAEPNVEAATVLATEVFPAIRREYPKAELRLVGRNPDPRVARLAGQGIIVTGAVPDMHVHLRAATIYVAPHFTGSGTRTKLLEAMAAGLPIITTSLGMEGMKVQPGRDLLVADQPTDMIESIQTLLASQPDRERFAQAARHMAEVWYDWSRCLWPLEPLYHNLLAPKAMAC